MRTYLASAIVAFSISNASAGVAPGAPSKDAPVGSERRVLIDSIDDSLEGSTIGSDTFVRTPTVDGHPFYVTDDDAATAWISKSDTLQISEYLGKISSVRLRLRNLTGADAKKFGRAKSVTVSVGDAHQNAELIDTSDWQQIVVPVLEPDGTSSVEIKILSRYPGTDQQYANAVAIADVQLFPTSMERGNPSDEKAKQQRVASWKKNRLANQAEVAAASVKPPFLPYQVVNEATAVEDTYQSAEKLSSLTEWKQDVAFAKKLIEQLSEEKTTMTFTTVKVTTQVAGGFPTITEGRGDYVPNGLVFPFINKVGLVSMTTTKISNTNNVTLAKFFSSNQGRKCRRTDIAWTVSDGKNKPVKAIVLGHCQMEMMREGSAPSNDFQVLIYGNDGLLRLVANRSGTYSGYHWEKRDGVDVITSGMTVAGGGYSTVSFKQ
jgi:hypothetical protein